MRDEDVTKLDYLTVNEKKFDKLYVDQLIQFGEGNTSAATIHAMRAGAVNNVHKRRERRMAKDLEWRMSKPNTGLSKKK